MDLHHVKVLFTDSVLCFVFLCFCVFVFLCFCVLCFPSPFNMKTRGLGFITRSHRHPIPIPIPGHIPCNPRIRKYCIPHQRQGPSRAKHPTPRPSPAPA
jgi:hypothetical protein